MGKGTCLFSCSGLVGEGPKKHQFSSAHRDTEPYNGSGRVSALAPTNRSPTAPLNWKRGEVASQCNHAQQLLQFLQRHRATMGYQSSAHCRRVGRKRCPRNVFRGAMEMMLKHACGWFFTLLGPFPTPQTPISAFLEIPGTVTRSLKSP